MIFIATLCRKLDTVKDLVTPLSEKHCFKTLFDSQHVKSPQTLVKSAWENFHQIFSSPWENLIWERSPLVICQILDVFRNTLTANDKYLVRDCENFLSPIQMQIALKVKNCSNFFVPFLESISNFKYFEIRDDRHSYFISAIKVCERLS